MTETAKRRVKLKPLPPKRKTAWPESRPRPEKVDGKSTRPTQRGPRGNGVNRVPLKPKLIRPGVNSYSLYNQRELVIAELLKQPSLSRAGRKLGISPKTIQRWLQTEEFNTQYRQAREQVLELSISTVGTHVSDAVETLARNLTCGRPDSEIRAAAVILQWAGKFIPGVDAKLASEKLAAAMTNGPAGATIIVVDGDEDNYIEGLKAATT